MPVIELILLSDFKATTQTLAAVPVETEEEQAWLKLPVVVASFQDSDSEALLL